MPQKSWTAVALNMPYLPLMWRLFGLPHSARSQVMLARRTRAGGAGDGMAYFLWSVQRTVTKARNHWVSEARFHARSLDTQNVALHMGKVKRRPSHPLRHAAVQMMMRGEATPAEIRAAIQVSRQLVYYWAREAGIAGKTALARKRYIWATLIKGVKRSESGQPEHPDVTMLRVRLAMPRPSKEQLAAAQAKHGTDHQAPNSS